MKKLLFILLLLPLFSFGQQGGITINQIQPNFQTGGVWKKMGTCLIPDQASETGLEEPSILYEGSPQILTNTTGSVFKMWFTADLSSAHNVMYAESLDGITWVRSSTVCISAHARGTILKVGSTYYYFCNPTPNFTQVDVYSSSTGAPGSWTLAAANIIAVDPTGGAWNHNSLANMAVYYDGTTYQMLLSANTSGGAVFTTGYYHSTSPTSGWIQYGSNPVMGSSVTPLLLAPGNLTKIGSTYYAWMFGGAAALLPTDGYRYSSTNLTTWTAANSGASTFQRTTADEGVGTSVGQIGNTNVIEANGKCYMYYSANSNGSGTPYTTIKVAIANMTAANLVLTNEGNGGNVTLGYPAVYDQVQSDYRYIPNATNVGANATWTTGTILIQDDSGYGIRLRGVAAPTTFSNITPGNLYLYNTNHASFLQANSTSLTISAYGGFNFLNGSGSGAATLGTFDNTGLLTTTNGVTTSGGGFTFNPTSAYGATNNPGIALRNQTAATSGVTARWSPALLQVGTAWSGSASQFVQFNQLVAPIGGTNPVTYDYQWRSSINLGTDLLMMKLNSNGTLYPSHLGSLTSAPTIAAGTGAGTSPTVSIAGNDIAQKVTITTGTSPTASATVATITFNVAYTTAPRVDLTPANAAAAALTGTSQVYPDDSTISTTSYAISVGSGGLTASTTYLFYAHVIQ